MKKNSRSQARAEFRRTQPVDTPQRSKRNDIGYDHVAPHPVDADLSWFVGVRWHRYASCYVWSDCPIFNAFGDVVGRRRGNTIYLERETSHHRQDLLHEVGHAVGRHFDMVGHRENHYAGAWDRSAKRLIGAIASGRHWSAYLNWYAARTRDFGFSAASEIWAELFMLHYLYPWLPEAGLIEGEIVALRRERDFCRLESALEKVGAAAAKRRTDSSGNFGRR